MVGSRYDAKVTADLLDIQQEFGITPSLRRDDIRYPLISRSKTICPIPPTLNVAGGWKAAFGTLSLDNDNVREVGRPTVKLSVSQTVGTASYAELYLAIPNQLINGPFEIWIKIPRSAISVNGSTGIVSSLINGQFVYSNLPQGSDPPNGLPSAYRKTPFFYPNNGQWDCFRFDISQTVDPVWAETGSPSTSYRCQYICLQISWQASTPNDARYINVDLVATGGKATPLIILANDNYVPTAILKKLPVLQQNGLVGTIFADGNTITGETATELLTLYHAGWSVGHQGMNHKTYTLGGNPAALDADCATAEAAMVAAGLPLTGIFAFPVNAAGPDQYDVLRARGYRFARAATEPKIAISSLGRRTLLGVGAKDTGQQSAATIEGWIDQTISNGTGLVLQTHEISASPANSLETQDTVYAAVASYLATKQQAGLLRVVTADQACDQLAA
ncbi:polysaccharide deacetylase family protein [Pleomorphomonas oryzae]|uniref:polysaccharide deacetylase family protein n=1 Tax=Pleomorphomonas oryzae TaxID=261934 RepID=UPI00041656DC|nr:polysaccharide deacetylase family protein [Pleomorphomonas oryzae]